MSAAERAARLHGSDHERGIVIVEPIRCHDCGQMLARRYADGSVEPVVVGARQLADGRQQITCPACERRVKVRAGKP